MVRQTIERKLVFVVIVFSSLFFAIRYLSNKSAPRDGFKGFYQETLDNQETREILNITTETYAHSITGKDFDFDKRTFITAQTILRTQTFAKKPIAMQNKATLPRLVPVTAISSNHFQESIDHIGNLPRFFADVKLVLFDLGLTEEQVQAIRKMSFVEYRKFDFLKYPPHVPKLSLFAWKVLIIQETLAEFGAIMWMDASVMLTGTYQPAIDQMVKEKSGFLFFNIHSRNRVVSAAHPSMLEYLPVVRTSAMRINYMQQANGMIIFNTLEVQRYIMKWAVLCALCKNCIAPLGAKHGCSKELLGKEYYINCHRYDQTMFNVLVGNANNFQEEKYVFNGERFSDLVRYRVIKTEAAHK